jgi:type I restriction enzyme M protein
MKHQTFSNAFGDIRNFLAGKAIGITRDRSLLHEVVKCLFCKMAFPQSTTGMNAEELGKLYRKTFRSVKKATSKIFANDDELLLDPVSIEFIDSKLSGLNLVDPHNDPLSELYQAFIGSEVRGAEGQFFTPTEAVRWLVEAIAPKRGERIIDPACGAGSFLSFSARHLRELGASALEINENLFGIEKDSYLASLANTHIALTTLKTSNIVCGDSIERKNENGKSISFEIDETFDIVFANPPFGAKIRIGSEASKVKFDLAYKWKRDKATHQYVRTNTLANSPSPQTLFLELCIKLLKPGGRLGIVVPESMISNSSAGYVVQYLIEHTHVRAVIGMPENLFKTSGKGGTHTKTCLLIAEKRTSKRLVENKIFMAEAKWCGHDSRGNFIPHNDLPGIFKRFVAKRPLGEQSHLGYYINEAQLIDFILAPRYYDPTARSGLNKLSLTHDMLLISDLIKDQVLEFSTGDEIGKLAYGTGDIPFIRTSDISNWEIKTDQKHGVSEEIYKQFCERQDVQEGDILMVRDGTYLIGTCAFVSKYNTKILYQSHLFKIRVKRPEIISPYLLLAALTCKQVISQIQSKRFTQDIIDSLGKRVFELVLPIPKDVKLRKEIEDAVRRSIHDRIEARELARKAVQMIGC